MTAAKTLLLIILIFAYSPFLFSAEPPLKLEATSPIEICPSCKDVRILLVPDTNSRIKLSESPKVEAVYFNGSSARDAGKFAASWIGTTYPREIRIALDSDETKRAGTYDFYLNLPSELEQSTGGLKIQVIRPAATLEAIPKLIINNTCWFIGLSSASYPDLLLTETSKKSGIMISGVRLVSNSLNGTKPVSGTLAFSTEQPEIKPGEQVKLNYSLIGNFGIGSTTGTMKIDSPQLSSPVSFDFEVNSRVHWIWIGITIVVALCISYLVKVKLQQVIELDQARLDAQKLIDRVNREAELHADPVFAVAYQHELSDLMTAVRGSSPNEINDRKVALDTKWQSALRDLAGRRKDVQDSLNKLHDIVTYGWPVPLTIVELIERARIDSDKVEFLINRDDLGAACDEIKKIISQLGEGIFEAAITWQTDERKILETIQNGPRGIPSTIPDISKTAGELRASLTRVDSNAKVETPENIHQALEDIKNERASVRAFFVYLTGCLEIVCTEAAIKIPQPPPANWKQSNFNKAIATYKMFRTFLETLVDNPNPPELIRQLAEVDTAWTAALQGQFDVKNVLVQNQLDAHDYVQATIVALEELTPRAGKTLLAPVFSATITMPRLDLFNTAVAQPMRVSHMSYQTITIPAPAIRTSVTLDEKLRKDKRFQSLMIGALLVVAGYGLQLNTFVGTFTDFSTIFFWAFALDLTVDQVGKITKKA